MRIRLALVISLLLALAAAGCFQDTLTGPRQAPEGTTLAKARNIAPTIIPPHARPHGKSYAEWSELWWQWMASAPALPDENPVLDHTGDLIDYAQSGPVWFVAQSVEPGVVREATIPAGKTLFICLAGFETSSWEGFGDTEEELRAAAAAGADLIEIARFAVDGTTIAVGPDFRTQSAEMFSLTVPDENVFDWWGFPAEAGTYYPSVADGYYVMLTPLPAGDHTLEIDWSILDLVAEVTIVLHVVGG